MQLYDAHETALDCLEVDKSNHNFSLRENKKDSFTDIELFAGGGGLALGLEFAGLTQFI